MMRIEHIHVQLMARIFGLLLLVESVSPALDPSLIPADVQLHEGKPTIRISLKGPVTPISPMLYGVTLDEVNFAYDGGLYPELVRTRGIAEPLPNESGWLLGKNSQGAEFRADDGVPLTGSLPSSLFFRTSAANADQPAALLNAGYFGISIKPSTRYMVSFYAKGSKGMTTLHVSLNGGDGISIYAKADSPPLTEHWQKMDLELVTPDTVTPDADARLAISSATAGNAWLNLVSVMPPTFNDRPNGMRSDLMEKLKALKPAFIEFPGVQALQGSTLNNRYDWKQMRGPLLFRRPHLSSKGYYCSGGMGLLEFMDCCEDLGAQPVLMVFAGFTIKQRAITAGPFLDPYVQDALDELEYLLGDSQTTYWGGLRAKDGHPDPFKLGYLQIGGDDNVDDSHSYEDRFGQFYDAIKTKYPDLKIIASAPVLKGPPDLRDLTVIDEYEKFNSGLKRLDDAPRKGQKIMIHAWACKDPAGSKNSLDIGLTPGPASGGAVPFKQVMANAAWMLAMEKNADLVQMSSYASVFSHVHEAGSWGFPDLLVYDGLNCAASPTYYVQQMFANHLGSVIPSSELQAGPSTTFPYDVTRDPDSGNIYVKMVNPRETPQTVVVITNGSNSVSSQGDVVSLHAEHLEDTNTLKEPSKIVPASQDLTDLSYSYEYTMPPYSVSVLTVNAK